MGIFIFDLQRFDAEISDGKVTIPANETYTLDGVTYKAGTDGAVLTLDDAGKVSGIASGSVTATIDGASESPAIIFDGTKAFEFTCEKTSTATGTDIINVRYQKSSISYVSGSATYSGTGVTFPAGDIGLAGTIANIVPFNINLNVPDSGSTVTFNDDGNINLKSADTLTAAVTFPSEIATLLENLKGVLPAILKISEESFEELYNFVTQLVSSTTTVALSGEAIYNRDAKTFSFAEGGTLNLNILNYGIKLTAVDGAIDGISLYYSKNGDDINAGVKIVPNSGNGKLGLDVSEDGKSIFKDVIEVTSGMLTLDPINSKFSADANTSFTIHVREVYIATLASTDAINVGISADGKGNISLTPDAVPFTFTLQRDDLTVFSGKFLVSGGSLVFNGEAHSLTMTQGTKATVNYGEYEMSLTANDAAGVEIVAGEDGTYSITPGKNDGSLDISLKQNGTTLFSGTLNVTDGTISFNPETQKFSFTEGTEFSFALDGSNSRQFGFKVVNGEAGIKFESDGNDNFIITPDKSDGSLDVSISEDSKSNATENSLVFNNKTDVGDIIRTMSLLANGISTTPTENGDTLDLTLENLNELLNANLEVLSGSFIVGQNGTATVTKDTELKLDFGDGYIVNFKMNDEAGSTISFNSETGITFTPNSEGGGLQLSVTRDGKTPSTSVDVTGSVTYDFDGSISLAKGAVVKNVFEEGDTLTITANTDASDAIFFNPQTGLTITSSSADALNVVWTTGDLDVVNVASIVGTINYQDGIFTASDGTKISMTDYEGYSSELTVDGGSLFAQYNNNRAVYTLSEGATAVANWSDGKTWRFKGGTLIDTYDGYANLSAGTVFDSNDDLMAIKLETAGTYTLNGMNITTSKDNVEVQMPDYNSVSFAADAGVTVSATEDKDFRFNFVDSDGKIKVTTTENGTVGISSGSVTFDAGKISITKGTVISLAQSEQVITLTAPEDISAPYKIEEDIYYFDLDNATTNFSVTNGDQTVFGGKIEIGGVFSYRPETGTFGLTGANSSHGNGSNTSAQLTIDDQVFAGNYGVKMATNDTTIVFIPKITDSKLEMNFPNERKQAMLFTLTKDGQTIFENNLAIDGKINLDTATQELSLTKDSVLTLTQGDNRLEITALDDAGGKLTFETDGIRFAPNAGDGALELNFINTGRKANLNVTGSVIIQSNEKISLEDGTELAFDWEDGTKLNLTSTGSTGSIGFGEKGIKITSDDENLSVDLTTVTGDQTHFSGIKGTVYYNAGKVSFNENSTITATTTLDGESVLITLETIDGTGYIDFNTSNGVIYSADSGAMKVTWTKDDLESTFTVNKGSVQIGNGLFQMSEGTDLAIDLKNFVPTLNFTTSEAGTYTINGQTITTTAANVAMTATDDYMSFATSDDVVTYNDMTFSGAGKVSLTSGGVVLGAGVEATGFGKDKSFVLAETGNVTADARIFELSDIEDAPIKIPMEITVTGAQDGFIFSRTLTKESEAYLDDALAEETFGNYSSSYIGKVFTEKFISAGDSSYRIRTDAIGLQEVIGISEGTTITGSASLADKPAETVFDVITESEGEFTIGERTYTISGDSSVAIMTDFEPDKSYVRGFKNLNGTVSGDFTENAVSINGSSAAVQAFGDTAIDIVADDSGFEILGLDANASLKVSATDTYKVNSTTIDAKAEDVIVGNTNGAAYIYNENYFDNGLSSTLITGTAEDDTIINTGTKVTINALGGNDFITNNVDSSVTAEEFGNSIAAGDGNDTIYNYHSYNPTINGGAGDDSIVVSRGHKTFIDGGAGNDTILGQLANIENDWAMGGYATILGGDGDDYIDTGYTNNSTINGGDGNDTIIISGLNNTIDGGGGSNIITMGEQMASFVVLNGKTTVEGFNTGFGEGSDTVLIKGESPAVDFKEEGLTLYYDDDSDNYLTFAKLSTTAGLNFYYEGWQVSDTNVFIADDEWYKVSDGEATYYVGATAKMNHGIDFSGISDALNISLDTDYAADVSFWVNNIYSIKGGDGLTTITGSEKSDTIIAGTGSTTINGAKGDDYISLNSGAALIQYAAGDGSDSIYGFNSNSTLSISGDDYSSTKSDDDLILTVGSEEITLFGAATLNRAKVISTISTDDIITEIIGDNDYTTTITDQDEVETLLESGNLDGDMALLLENKSADFSKADGSKSVTLTGGANQDVKFNKEGYNVAVVDADTKGKKNISLGGGGDLAVVEDTKTRVNITASKGNDTIVSQSENVSLNLRGGKTDILATSGKIKISGYDPATGSGFHTDYADILTAINDGEILFDKSKIKIGDAVIIDSNGNNLANFYDADGNLQKVGDTPQDGALNLSRETANWIVSAKENSTLTTGAGNDTIFAFAGSKVDAGAGRNYIDIEDRGANEQGATVVLGGGKNTIASFTAGFEDTSDRLFCGVNDTVNFKFDGTELKAYINNKLSGILPEIDSEGSFVNFLMADANGSQKIVAAQTGETITVDDELADLYTGKNSAVDFTNYDGTLNINLGSQETSIGAGEILFNGINQITAGSGFNTLRGSSRRETLTGNSEGITEFIFGAGGGRDVISNFNFDDDKINVGSDAVTDVRLNSDGDVRLQIGGGEDWLTIEDAQGKNFKINNFVAKVDRNIEYDDAANYFVATSRNATLTVGDSVESSAIIWLNNPDRNGSVFAGDIKTLDASNATVKAELAGNELDNTILAGQGDASLWGGTGGNDLLQGGAGKNTFFYALGNGSDTISGTNDGDIVYLSGVTLENIIGADFASGAVNLRFSDGGKLTVTDTNKDVSFIVGDQTFYVNNEHSGFTTEK